MFATFKLLTPKVDGAIGWRVYRVGQIAIPIPRTWWQKLLFRPVRYRYEETFNLIAETDAEGNLK